MQAGERFNVALAELETVGDRKCYQGLGKAFVFQTKDQLVDDYKSLKETNIKELEDVSVSFS